MDAVPVRVQSTQAAHSYKYRSVTRAELKSVMDALPGVVWRKCINGHVFAVGECGTPTVVGNCI
ncbi:hypothetical protein GGI11_006424, partial [Coemansia sp. RSA 2049]